MRKNNPSQFKGFTLIEVLVAVTILAIVGTATSGLIRQSAKNIGYLEQNQLANWVAQNTLAEHRLKETWPRLEPKYEKVEMANQTFHVFVQGVETEDPTFRQLKVVVRQTAEPTSSSLVQMVTYVVQKK